MCAVCKALPAYVQGRFSSATIRRAALTPEAWHMWTVQPAGEADQFLVYAVSAPELMASHIQSASDWMINVSADRFLVLVEPSTQVPDDVRRRAQQAGGEVAVL